MRERAREKQREKWQNNRSMFGMMRDSNEVIEINYEFPTGGAKSITLTAAALQIDDFDE